MPGYEVIDDQERDAVLEVFERSNGVLWAHGFDELRNGLYRVREFEDAFIEMFGCRYAQAVASGTAALKTALKALAIGPGDEVITSAFTFVATVETIVDCGATAIIVDVDRSLNMSPDALERAFTKHTRAVIPVHMMGNPCRIDSIVHLCAKHDAAVIEDNAQSCGASYGGKLLGTFGDAGIFSFDFGKMLTCGEGGVVATDRDDVFSLARAYHDHGHEYNARGIPRGQESALLPGWNFRMGELNAAVGLVQLRKLENILQAHRDHKELMKKALTEAASSIAISFRDITDPGESADCLVLYTGSKERALKAASMLATKGIGTKNLPDALRWHFAGCWEHLFSTHPRYGSSWASEWAKTEELLGQAIAFPVFVRDSRESIESRMKVIVDVLQRVR